ncbi:MAG: ABC transporter ATP-binding protein [Tissierellia bacterium]|nr:ABC transporter ATP-binding protein [Tissierellia bacterium]
MDIRIRNINHWYGDNHVVEDVSLDVREGELVALLGPSGCGKTTLLRLVAGLIPLKDGQIYFGEKDVSQWQPQKRNAVMVFQSYALFPHMSVEENISYGLKVRKINHHVRKELIQEIMEKVELTGYADRKIQELSGGQQQRVALARSLVVEPDVLLFDEPLSNLDEKLRVSMRQEIRKIQKSSQITSIYVTHDQEEAMSIADRIVIMNKGKIQQIGSPREVYEKPLNTFVANFMGESNYFVDNGVTRMCRPDAITLSTHGEYQGKVAWVEYLGSTQRLTLDWEDRQLIVDVFNRDLKDLSTNHGDRVSFDMDKRALVTLEDTTSDII